MTAFQKPGKLQLFLNPVADISLEIFMSDGERNY